jgi:hypothetical protein
VRANDTFLKVLPETRPSCAGLGEVAKIDPGDSQSATLPSPDNALMRWFISAGRTRSIALSKHNYLLTSMGLLNPEMHWLPGDTLSRRACAGRCCRGGQQDVLIPWGFRPPA